MASGGRLSKAAVLQNMAKRACLLPVGQAGPYMMGFII